jgi:hypothetical protein
MAGKTTVEGKFSQLLMRDGEQIIAGRGKRTVESAFAAQQKLVMDLEERKRVLEDRRELMLDQSPDNTYSLQIGVAFDAQKFTTEYQKLSIDLINLEVELKIAKANSKELFGA